MLRSGFSRHPPGVMDRTLTSRAPPEKAPEIFASLRRFEIDIRSRRTMTVAREERASDQ